MAKWRREHAISGGDPWPAPVLEVVRLVDDDKVEGRQRRVERLREAILEELRSAAQVEEIFGQPGELGSAGPGTAAGPSQRSAPG